jgi:hypothetical protein
MFAGKHLESIASTSKASNTPLQPIALGRAPAERQRWAALIRIWPALAVLSTMAADAAIRSTSPDERPIGIETESGELIVKLDRGSTAHFALDGKSVTHLLVRLGNRQLSADMRACALPRSIHKDDMRLVREDLREDEHRIDLLTLHFDVGSESDRAFGKLPRVQLSWANGELAVAMISHQIATNHGFSSPLCSPDVQPNKRFERTPVGNAPLLGISNGAAQAQRYVALK